MICADLVPFVLALRRLIDDSPFPPNGVSLIESFGKHPNW